MTTAGISLAQSPPLSVPARFFATAPLFGVLAGVVMTWAGSGGLSDRWMPAVLAATHLLTLGYMGMIMLGALMQVFPVVIGHPFRRSTLVSTIVHASLTLGIVLLSSAFLVPRDGLLVAALLMLAAALLIFLAAASATLWNVEAWGDTASTIALALLAFAVMTGLGLWLALGHTSYLPLPRSWTDIHAGWGLAGWVPLLLMGVAYQVVPMFQLTPDYPRVLRRIFPVALFTMLLAGTLAHGLGLPEWTVRLPQVTAALVLAGFAVATLELQRRRRRKRPDVTVAYWRVGLACLILAVLLWTAGQLPTKVGSDPRYALMLGVLMIPGFSLSVINGMLYKIVPFLVWLHLTMAPAGRAAPPTGPAPGVKQIIPDQHSRLQLRVHTLALLLISAGVLGVPGVLRAGALAFTLACVLLGRDILSAVRLYRVKAGSAHRSPAAPQDARD
ncbi:MAG TPA: hypothetical protein VK973_07655 [Arenicellales bacterium]|nr:hypothetical protein [Arenicellales bacterium]